MDNTWLTWDPNHKERKHHAGLNTPESSIRDWKHQPWKYCIWYLRGILSWEWKAKQGWEMRDQLESSFCRTRFSLDLSIHDRQFSQFLLLLVWCSEVVNRHETIDSLRGNCILQWEFSTCTSVHSPQRTISAKNNKMHFGWFIKRKEFVHQMPLFSLYLLYLRLGSDIDFFPKIMIVVFKK